MPNQIFFFSNFYFIKLSYIYFFVVEKTVFSKTQKIGFQKLPQFLQFYKINIDL